MIRGTSKLRCKPFKNTHEEQIKLVNSFDWLDISKLNGIDEEFRELVRDSLFIDTARCDAICKALKQRISSLESLINDTARRKNYNAADTRGDVLKDISYSGVEL